MSNEVIKILDDLGKRFGIAIDWSQDNIVPYIQDLIDRIIVYEIYTSVAWIIIFILLSLGSIICIYKINNYTNRVLKKDPNSSWDIGRVIAIVLLLFLIVFFIFGIFVQIFNIITCYTIPEKILIDFIKMQK